MKKNVLSLFVFIAIGLAASAQTEQGNWLAGGNIELNTAKQATVINLSPSAGYFFANNFAAGANLVLDYSKVGSTKTTATGIGPFARYYFGKALARPFLHGDIDFLSTKTKIGTVSTTSTGTQYYLAGGLAVFLNKSVALEGTAGYSHTAYAHQDGSGGFDLRIGFQVYLSRGGANNVGR